MERRSSLDGVVSPLSPGLNGRPWSGAGTRRASLHRRGIRSGTPKGRDGGAGSGIRSDGTKKKVNNGRIFDKPLATAIKIVAGVCKTTHVIIVRVPPKYDHDRLTEALTSALPRCVVAPPMSVRDMCIVGILPFGVPKKRSRAMT
jgi:hypothetical protein